MKNPFYFTVSNDLTYDQRMRRICRSLAQAGYEPCLVGRRLRDSKPLAQEPYEQKRLNCFFKRGKLFYLALNLRLFLFLLWHGRKARAFCAIDLDTLLACAWAARFWGKPYFYDAHEYFTEVPELVNRPRVQALWSWVARRGLVGVKGAYTVSPSLAKILSDLYQIHFECIRNLPKQKTAPPSMCMGDKFILLYQGALNRGRGLEAMLRAMPLLSEQVVLWLAGEGDCSEDLRNLAKDLGLDEERVVFWGFVLPDDLAGLTQKAHLGLNLLEAEGLSYYYSLANKFFDYVQARIPSLNPDFPEYRVHLEAFRTGLLAESLEPSYLADLIEGLRQDREAYRALVEACEAAAKVWIWEEEQRKLLAFYEEHLSLD